VNLNVDLCQSLAKRWMVGTRQSKKGKPPREAWRHPEDLIKITDEWPFPSAWNHNLRTYLKCVLWLHDLIEDGKKEDGSPVTEEDLIREGVSLDIVRDVVALSCPPGVDKKVYLQSLKTASVAARIAKCIDRIGNLREGAEVFKDARWARYVEETNTYILPMSFSLHGWLTDQLEAAVGLRPVS
jgi:hypothetical protein